MGAERRVPLADVVLALVVTFLAVNGTVFGADDFSAPDRDVDGVAVALVAVAGLSLVVRRRWTEVTAGVVTACVTVYLWLSYPYGPALAPLFVAIYSLARHRPLARAGAVAAAALVVLLTHLPTHADALAGWAGVVPATAWVAVPFAIGVVMRSVVTGRERDRAEALRERVNDERLRVAHEVHDVVGHGLAAIQMQADIALHVMDRDPEAGRRALEAISRSSEDAMRELRSTLQVVRREAPRTPGPGAAEIEALCRRTRDAGVDLDLEITGERRDLPSAVDLAAYRVVQESLTNVVRHGSVSRARVQVDYAPDSVTLRVSNPGPAGRTGSGGLGIDGMRRRVTELGGTFAAGPASDEFVVTAALPTGEES